MDPILAWLNCHVHSFPLVIFIALLLGGFNVPISEDVLVITSAILCQTEKAHIAPFYLAIFFGCKRLQPSCSAAWRVVRWDTLCCPRSGCPSDNSGHPRQYSGRCRRTYCPRARRCLL